VLGLAVVVAVGDQLQHDGDQSPFFPRHNLSINGVGDHQHGLGAQNGSPVLPYACLTPFRKG
jgi:hypothetical protein